MNGFQKLKQIPTLCTIMHPLLIANMNLIYPGDHIFTGVDLIDGIWTAGDEQQYKKRT